MIEVPGSKRYTPRFIDLNNKNISHSLIVDLIGRNKKVLEIGTSTGYVSKILTERGNLVTGIEIDKEAAEIASNYCESMIIGDIEEIDMNRYLESYSYDVIVVGDILEHLKNPEALLEQLKNYLKTGGYIVVSLPNFCHGDVILNLLLGDFRYTETGLLDETHLRFFAYKNIINLFNKCGYAIENVQKTTAPVGGTEQKKDLESIPDSILKFIKSLPHSDTYQFVFKAIPDENTTKPDIPELSLHELFECSFKEFVEEHTNPLNQELKELGNQIKERDNRIKKRDSQIKYMYQLLQTHTNRIKELIQQGQDQHSQITEIQNRNSLLEAELKDIKQSFVWKTVTRFHNELIERILPQNTRRRNSYELGIIGLRTLVNEGFGALVYKIRNRYGQKDHNASNISIIETIIAPPLELFSLEKKLCVQFTFTENNLNGIKIFTATYQRQNSDIEFQVTDSTGQVLRRGKTNGYRIRDNDYTSFEFKPIKNSKGRIFFFKMRSKGETSAAVWHSEKRTSSGLNIYYNNEQVEGSIGLQAFANLRIKNPYDLWILKNELTEEKLDEYKKEAKNFSYQPKISIVTPVYNPDLTWIQAAIESVLNQAYQNWELCIADASTKEDVIKCLNSFSKKDSRIKVKFLSENKGISGNSNEALSLATGEYIGLLDHDDKLSPDALYEVTKYLQENPDVNMIYSDEDKMDLKGNRVDPFFKPDWSPDVFMCHNYLCHFSVIRKDIVEKVGGFRVGFDGSQDYDLFLRVTELSEKIGHIPKILYHWRIVPGSTSEDISNKSYVLKATKNALMDAVKRRKLNAEVVNGLFPNSCRVKYRIMRNPNISIIIPTKDKVEVLRNCIESILEKTDYSNYEIIVIDNQSYEEATFEYYKKIESNPKIKILSYREEFNFSAINNFAISQVGSDYVVLLNNDTEVISREWLPVMLEHAQRKEVGAVGAKLIYSNNTIQHAGIIIGIVGNPPVGGHSHKYFPKNDNGYFGRIQHICNVSAVTAACIMMRKEVFEEVGGFDEKNLSVAFNDVDLCLKIREKGYLIIYTPYAELYHHESLSRGYEDTPGKQRRFLDEVKYMREKWGKIMDAGDPYYNKNLTLEKEDFSIRI
ncbi:MAG: hypothetical protein QG646_2325 [Euryarchaeota archaeon]|nr:hypothetical protein [Euryarchaeota archaeon]